MSKFIPDLRRLDIECWILGVQFILAIWNIQYRTRNIQQMKEKQSPDLGLIICGRTHILNTKYIIIYNGGNHG